MNRVRYRGRDRKGAQQAKKMNGDPPQGGLGLGAGGSSRKYQRQRGERSASILKEKRKKAESKLYPSSRKDPMGCPWPIP